MCHVPHDHISVTVYRVAVARDTESTCRTAKCQESVAVVC